MIQYHPLTETEAVEYARSIPGLFPEGAALTSREIGDGNLNLVFHIREEGREKGVILKQALPYARVVGESWPLTLDRARIESEALQEQAKLAKDLVPHVYRYDADLALTVMEDLSDHIVMRKGLMARQRYPHFARHMARFLARTLFFTSDFYLDRQEKKAWVRRFLNPQMCDITEGLVFTDPYYDAETNSFNPLIKEEVEAIWRDVELKREIAELKEAFMTKAQALVHGDLHTGSIMVTETSTKVIDPEFAYYGPMGFDIGALFANLLLSYASHVGHTVDEEVRTSYQAWLLETIETIWHGFEGQFSVLWKEHVQDEMWRVPGYRERFLARVLQESAGFAGCKMLRRVIGLAPVADLETIEDPHVRAEAELLALHIGQALIKRRKTLETIEQLTAWVREVTKEKVVK